MTQAEAAKLIAVITMAYPNRIQADQVQQMITVWTELLDLTYSDADAALRRHIQESKWPPSIAELLEQDRTRKYEEWRKRDHIAFAASLERKQLPENKQRQLKAGEVVDELAEYFARYGFDD